MIRAARPLAIGILLLWSVTGAAQEPVHFSSFEDNGVGVPSTVLNGYLWRPAGAGLAPITISIGPTCRVGRCRFPLPTAASGSRGPILRRDKMHFPASPPSWPAS
jgi:hypothetical protein